MIRHLRAFVLTWLLILSTGLLLVASTATPSFAADPERPATTASNRYDYTTLVVKAPLFSEVSNHASRPGCIGRVAVARGPSLFAGFGVAAKSVDEVARVGDTVLYQKLGPAGEHLKYGITKSSATRYTSKEMNGRSLNILARGSKPDMLALERSLHETLPIGPEEGQLFYIQKQIANGLRPPPYPW